MIKHEEGEITIPSGTHIGYVPQTAGFDLTFPITVSEVVLSGTLDSRISPFRTYSKTQKEKQKNQSCK